jgi:CRISPR-associated protein Csm5
MINELGHTLKFNCKVLTPLHIGMGESYSPLTSYFLDKEGNVNLIDESEFGKILAEKSITDKFCAQVLSMAGSRKNELISEFFYKHNIESNLSKISKKIIRGHKIVTPTEINKFIIENDRYFVPGSTLKGAIISSAIYSFLQEPLGEDELKIWIDALWDAESNDSFKKEVKLDKLLLLNDRFNSTDLHIKDTFVNGNAGVYSTNRIKIVDEEDEIDDMSLLKECIEPNSIFDIKIDFRYYKREHHDLRYNYLINSIMPKKEGKIGLIKVINTKSKELLEYEINELESNYKFEGYVEYLKIILDKIEKHPDKAYLRIGAGKMNFYQSIGLSLHRYLEKYPKRHKSDTWLLFLEYCFDRQDLDDTDIVPGTRVVCTENQQPMGWIEMSLNSNI